MMPLRSLATAVTALLLAAGCAQVSTLESGAVAQGESAAAPAPSTTPAQRVETPAPPVAQAPEPPRPPANIWERMRPGLRLAPLNTPLVQEWEQYYSRRPDYFARMVERSGRYLYHVIEEV